MVSTPNPSQAVKTRRVIIDTDPGIDDAAAILMALGSPEIQVEALTTVFGNAPVASSTRNALRILQAADRTDIPVYEGVGKPYNGRASMFAAHVHGSDGFGDGIWPLPTTICQPRYAVIELIERVLQAPGEITLVALGRLTNIALALSIEPRLAEALHGIVVMGGAIGVPGNASSVASANLWGDPEAADVVYRSGARIVQIGLDVCNQAEISLDQQMSVWQTQSPAARLLETLTPYLKQSYNQRGLLRHPQGIRYNDMPALAYVIDASLFTCQDVYIRIETQGQYTRGQTVADLEGQSGEKPNVTAAFDVDVPRLTALWVERVKRLRSMSPRL